MRVKVILFQLLLCAALLLPGFCDKPGAGTLTGVITDPHGAIIQGVNIRVQHWKFDFDKGFQAKAQCDGLLYSDKNGRFTAKLPSGTYDLFVTSPGMSPVAKEVEIKPGQATTLDFQLVFSPLTKFIE